MPFLGQDWRSPGWTWMKTDDGWKRCDLYYDFKRDNNFNDVLNGNEELYTQEECEFSAKRKKEHFNNTTKSQNFYNEKWIYVHKGSTRERHGYCTLGEAFNRLDFSSAIRDMRRFNYVVKPLYNRDCCEVGYFFRGHQLQKNCTIELLQLIAKSQLTSLSGAAQKNYFNILETIVLKALEDQHNPRLIKELLQDLSSTLCSLIRGVGKFVLIGNINIWISRLETILLWQEELMNLQISQQFSNGDLTLCDLPLTMQNNILHRFSDAWDIVNLGQVTPTMHMLSEDRHLWKKLCKYHFAEKMFCRHLIFSEKGHVDWKLMFFTLKKYYPQREQYGDTLHFCRHCSILFWKDTGHPCTAIDPGSCLMPVSPQHFIDLFRF